MGNKIINGWNMLDSYSEGQIIYGRDDEITSVKESILYNIQTFLYGKSGVGKTSLLQAGIFPELRRANYFPVVIRLAFYNGEPLNHVVKRLVEEEAEREDPSINKVHLFHATIDDTDVSDSPLYEYFSKVRFEDEEHTPYIPVLILDQFEETINNEEQWQRTVDFLKDDLYDLMDNSNVIRGTELPYTNYRIVFSMREDYLYCLEDIVDQYSLWELRYNRYRIKALDDERAAEVIRRTSGVNGLEAGQEDKIIDVIIKVVKSSSSSRFTEINTALLSLICSLLHENSGDGCIRYNDLRKVNTYVNTYYDDICAHIGNRATRYLEQHLLTSDGRRSSIDESEALYSRKVRIEHLDYLVEKRLIRRIKTDNTSTRYEYIHDLFAKMVHKRRNEERKRWFIPEYRSISKSHDGKSFVVKMLLTTCVLLPIIFLALLFHARIAHNTNNIFVCLHPAYYLGTLALIIYWIPLWVKYLHYKGHSGWNLMLVPASLLLICIEHYTGSMISSKLLTIIHSTGVGLLAYFLYNLLITRKNPKQGYSGCSKEYELTWNGANINNIEFIKMFTVEIICWCLCCVIVESVYFALNEISTWILFKRKLSLFLMDKLGLEINLPIAVALLPGILMFSHSLKVRAKSMGYHEIHAWIPYWNLSIFLFGLLPDKLLRRLKLDRKQKNKEISEDNVFPQIYSELIASDNTIQNSRKTRNLISASLIPFYGLIKCFSRTTRLKTAYWSKGCSAFVIWSAMVAFISLIYFLDNQKNETIIIFVIALITEIASAIIMWIPMKWLIKRDVIIIIKSNPTYTTEQIINDMCISPKLVKRHINKLMKKNILSQYESDGKMIWQINENEYTSSAGKK